MLVLAGVFFAWAAFFVGGYFSERSTESPAKTVSAVGAYGCMVAGTISALVWVVL